MALTCTHSWLNFLAKITLDVESSHSSHKAVKELHVPFVYAKFQGMSDKMGLFSLVLKDNIA